MRTHPQDRPAAAGIRRIQGWPRGKRLTGRLRAGFAAYLVLCTWSLAAHATLTVPWSKGYLIFHDSAVTDTFALNVSGNSTNSHAFVVIGSPSGNAHSAGAGFTLTLQDSLHNTISGSPALEELWLVGGIYTDFGALTPRPLDIGNLECSDPVQDLEPYLLVGFGSAIHPAFGGSGHGEVTVKIDPAYGSPDYHGIIGFDIRSTDADGDGDTDDDDTSLLRAAIGGSDHTFDLDNDGYVDEDDLAIMRTEASATGSSGKAYCTNADGTKHSYNAATDFKSIAPSSPTSFTMSNSAGNWQLSWVNGGDDGATGQAYKVELRTSTSPITAANFGSATLITMLTPNSSGVSQSYTTSYSSATVRYFAIRSTDDLGLNSTVVACPPGQITDLSAAAGRGNIKLAWTAPSEQGGTVSTYDIRMCQCASGSFSWTTATGQSGPTPGAPGNTECDVISGLDDGTTYSFAVKSQDAAGNWSAMSNVASATTRTTGSLTYSCDPGLIANFDGLGASSPVVLALSRFAPNPTADGGTSVLSVPDGIRSVGIEAGAYDVFGRRIRVLAVSGTQGTSRTLAWDLRDASGQKVQPGVYFIRAVIGGTELQRSLVVSK